MQIGPLGDQALLVTLADAIGEAACARVQQAAGAVAAARLAGVAEVVPAFTTLAVFLQPHAEWQVMRARVMEVLAVLPAKTPLLAGREVEVPVIYGGDEGPDLPAVARHAGLAEREVIARHAGADFRVHAVGFTPGFPYLAGLPATLHVPRRAVPRTRVSAGSVAIGGGQAGIYPVATSGGWNVIGRTNLRLFDPTADPPARLRVGDRVRFRPVEELAFDEIATGRAAAAGGEVEVLHPGLHTSVQDLGRPGWQQHGVSPGGAMDAGALRLANLLVGNDEGAAGLEWSWRGPVLRFDRARWVALVGQSSDVASAGRPVRVGAGEVLDLSAAPRGGWACLAVGGGIAVEPVLGSRATFAAGGWGGLGGRGLRAGDRLRIGPGRRLEVAAGWFAAPEGWAGVGGEGPLRVVRGPQAEWFGAEAWRVLLTGEFRVAADSNRMGVRLEGPGVRLDRPREAISEPVAEGAIQVPPGGGPIVLLAERQTLGGYPKMAHVITVDVPRLAQRRPGEVVRFSEVSLAEADALRRDRAVAWARLRTGLATKLGAGCVEP